MFKFSSNTIRNDQIPIDLIIQKSLDKNLKKEKKFIKSIIIKNKISSELLNYESEDLDNLFILEIDLKVQTIPYTLINNLNEITKGYVYFILKYDDLIAYLSTAKKKNKDSKYDIFCTDWSNKNDFEQIDIPLFSNVRQIYLFMVSYFTKINFFEDESVYDYFSRYEKLKKIEKDINKNINLKNKTNQPWEKNECHNIILKLEKEKTKLLEKRE